MKSLEQKAKQKVVKCGWGAGSCTLSALGSKCVSGCCKRLSSRWRSHSVLTQGSNFARCPNQKQINQDSKTICRSQLVTRRSHNGQVEVPCPFCARKATEVTQRHALLISLHLLHIPAYCTASTFAYPEMKWKWLMQRRYLCELLVLWSMPE